MTKRDAPDDMRETEIERTLFEFQHSAACYAEAFYRYIGSRLAALAENPNLTGQDCFMLHAVAVGGRPKSMTDLQHFANRTDIANVQYSVRKLAKAGLIEKSRGTTGRGTTYCLTARGGEIVDRYVDDRRRFIAKIAIEPDRLNDELQRATDLLQHFTGLYDHASRSLAAS